MKRIFLKAYLPWSFITEAARVAASKLAGAAARVADAFSRPVLAVAFSAVFFLAGCFDLGTRSKVDFDREAFLIHYADEIIIPRYREFASQTEALHGAFTVFEAEPSLENLDSLRVAHFRVQENWQRVSPLRPGPSQTMALVATVNSFPPDTAGIDTNILLGGYNLDAADQLRRRGLPALDYVLHEIFKSDTASWTTDSLAANRITYVGDLTKALRDQAAKVLSEWEDSYREIFISKTGTDVGSSLGKMINDYVKDYEELKNLKVGYPLGIFNANTISPDLIEARFSGRSSALVEASLQGHLDFFLGKSDSLGLDDYLDALGAKHDDTPLAEAIEQQFESALEAWSKVEDPLAEALETDNETVHMAWKELQKQVVLLKVDMVSALSVLITYQDNDGD